MSSTELVFLSTGAAGLLLLLVSLMVGEFHADPSASTELVAHVDLDNGHDYDGPSWHSLTVIIDKLVVFGGGADGKDGISRIAGSVPQLMAQVVEAAKATGIDIGSLLGGHASPVSADPTHVIPSGTKSNQESNYK